MAVPAGLTPDLTAYFQDIEDRVGALETPMGFTPAYLTTSSNLNTLNAAQSGGRWAFATDLKVVVYSDGAHWYNTTSGATIV